jgi:N-acetylneuraminate epimerase
MGAVSCSSSSYRVIRLGSSLGFAVLLGLLLHRGAVSQDTWTELPPLPDRHGYAGAFVGLIEGQLIVLGGANFPTAPPWEGGIKRWSKKLYRLPSPQAKWIEGPDHREELGYGVSITTAEGLVCIGGSNANQHRDSVFLLRRKPTVDNSFVLEEIALPSLPKTLANMCGVRARDYLYVMGGTNAPDASLASSVCLRLHWTRENIAKQLVPHRDSEWRWEVLPGWPGSPRMLAVAAAIGDNVFLAGGVALSTGSDGKPVRQYLQDVFIYSPRKGWDRAADLPTPLAASPSPAWVHGNVLSVIGGDTGARAKFAPSPDHPGFSRSEYLFDVEKQQWRIGMEVPVASVTTNTVEWLGNYVVPTGEIRPGVRTPKVWARAIK